MITALDTAIGRVLQSLEPAGVADNTLVFFYSDNGAFLLGRKDIDIGSNDPLRSGGFNCWEGGLRVVALARWPGKIPAETVVSATLWSPDLLPTCAAVANARLPANVILDGHKILPVLTENAPSPHQSLYFNYQNHAALRMGDWKIMQEKPDHPWQLFDLQHDISEAQNLAASRPEIVQQLQAARSRWEQSFKGPASSAASGSNQ